ncbi:hypothetical protein QF049_004801 [Paenibacillus sp. W4I10]|uniref:hypothetical protein n=1 Tax=Paenibacillus sp. W4I10 TaxID=3042298 RepID=UPI002786D924|nr:hypothetical protein [Paenibacillus sp. W4I10]MDQ0723540.1 hypothetical protein [Paenibacillus sp. W4I10]
MGTTAFFLTEREKYTPEKFLSDTMIAAFNSDNRIILDNHKNLKNGKFSSTTLNILAHSYNSDDNNHQFIMYVKAKENKSGIFGDYEGLDLDPNHELIRVGTIEEVFGAEEVILRFVYEYLNLNRSDYFWVSDYDWVFTWEDIQKINSMIFDSDWCYKDPKMI